MTARLHRALALATGSLEHFLSNVHVSSPFFLSERAEWRRKVSRGLDLDGVAIARRRIQGWRMTVRLVNHVALIVSDNLIHMELSAPILASMAPTGFFWHCVISQLCPLPLALGRRGTLSAE